MNYERAYSELKRAHDGFASLWVYGLTVVLAMWMAFVGNELHTAGLMSTDAAEGLVFPMQLIATVGLGGVTIQVLYLLFGVLAWVDERGDSS